MGFDYFGRWIRACFLITMLGVLGYASPLDRLEVVVDAGVARIR